MAKMTIRPLHPNDLEIVRDLGKRVLSYPLGQLMAVTMTSQGFVAQDDTQTVIAAILLRTESVGGYKIGILDWAVVDPIHQGRGLSIKLGNRAMIWFRQQGCSKVITTDVDGYNSAAWRAAHFHNLRFWPVSKQIQDFGWSWPKLFAVVPHLGVTTFILHLDLENENQTGVSFSSGLGLLFGTLIFLGVFLLPLSQVREVLWESRSMSHLLAPLGLSTVVLGVSVLALYMAVRTCVFWWIARLLKVPVGFRIWDSGLILAFFVALIFGGFMPGLAGNVYVRGAKFNYNRSRPVMGKIMLGGVVASLFLFTLFTVWTFRDTHAINQLPTIGRYIGMALGITDCLMFFSPFQALPAGHIWLWQRKLWLLVCFYFFFTWFILPQLL